jgi:hypothetical protein
MRGDVWREEGSCIWEGNMSACRRGVVVVYVRGLSWGKARLGVIRDALHRSSKAPVLFLKDCKSIARGKDGQSHGPHTGIPSTTA